MPNSASEAPPTSPWFGGEAKEPSKPEKPAPKKADKKPKSVYVAPALNATEKSQFEKIMARRRRLSEGHKALTEDVRNAIEDQKEG